jgi:glycosyltransferase involved in cell wall biosynthesis
MMVTSNTNLAVKTAVQPEEAAAAETGPRPAEPRQRPKATGKFIFDGKEKLWIKGVTYGTFRPDEDNAQFPAREIVERDLKAIRANGFNTIRTYTVPPRWLLDSAWRHGLRVMVGLPWAQHIAFLDDASVKSQIVQSIRAGVRACAGHSAVLCYTLGNEIPPSIVRWHGHRAIERFIEKLYRVAKAEDPEALFTYVNFPTTEYLSLPFLDIVCFNVYLESREKLSGYLARLQNIAGERPLLMAEIGLDSRRNGEDAQADSLSWQIETAFSAGCAGAFAFAWTDEWYRGGFDIEDWDFGLTARDRTPKPALAAARDAFAAAPFRDDIEWPKVSVVVCSYNGEPTIRDTLEGLSALEYPNYEVIVVNDGSTDATAKIAAEYDFRLISTENRGLSNARNTGWQEATGDIVAYTDDDAWPDPHWLHYLAHTFMTTDYVGVGGPNIPPPGDGPIGDCVANAPGGPVHVLVSDTEAEHIPGCNMAFRREALAAIDGFDPQYRAAGDDVDLCWRLQERGGRIGFHACAVVWHHRRNSVKTYWKQQQGYGKAEALLEAKWPEKYNVLGHVSWAGRLYGNGLTEALRARRERIYQGQWGTALFQSIYEPAPGLWLSLPLMPEWFLLLPALVLISLLGLSWPPLLWALPLAVIAAALPLAQAVLSATKARFPTPRSAPERSVLRALTAILHLVQPIARLKGRLEHGLTLWRRRIPIHRAWQVADSLAVWSEVWHSADTWLERVAAQIREHRTVVRPGGTYDNWDLEIRGGVLAGTRVLLGIEDHGAGRQMLRFRCRARVPFAVMATLGALFIGGLAAAASGAWLAAGVLGFGFAALASATCRQSADSLASVRAAVDDCVEARSIVPPVTAPDAAGEA